MSDDALIKEARSDIQWYEDDIPLRGCQLNLQQVKAAYRELATLTKKEGDRIIGSLVKPEELNDDDFVKRNEFLKKDAFRITVSIVGFDKQTTFGDTEEIFDSKNLPLPIRTIFFTNSNSFKRHSNQTEPPNRFSVWMHFDKPPLFDPNPLVSEPTRNFSQALIYAEDVGYYRAVQTIISKKLGSHKKWYAFIHERFAYDMGLWFFALPYSLYWITIYVDYLFPSDGKNASFRVAFYIYGLGLCILAYRALFSYIKWAFPVNILEENRDQATRHRITLGALMVSLIVSGIKSVLSTIARF